jgi:hypothetical protein
MLAANQWLDKKYISLPSLPIELINVIPRPAWSCSMETKEIRGFKSKNTVRFPRMEFITSHNPLKPLLENAPKNSKKNSKTGRRKTTTSIARYAHTVAIVVLRQQTEKKIPILPI